MSDYKAEGAHNKLPKPPSNFHTPISYTEEQRKKAAEEKKELPQWDEKKLDYFWTFEQFKQQWQQQFTAIPTRTDYFYNYLSLHPHPEYLFTHGEEHGGVSRVFDKFPTQGHLSKEEADRIIAVANQNPSRNLDIRSADLDEEKAPSISSIPLPLLDVLLNKASEYYELMFSMPDGRLQPPFDTIAGLSADPAKSKFMLFQACMLLLSQAFTDLRSAEGSQNIVDKKLSKKSEEEKQADARRDEFNTKFNSNLIAPFGNFLKALQLKRAPGLSGIIARINNPRKGLDNVAELTQKKQAIEGSLKEYADGLSRKIAESKRKVDTQIKELQAKLREVTKSTDLYSTKAAEIIRLQLSKLDRTSFRLQALRYDPEDTNFLELVCIDRYASACSLKAKEIFDTWKGNQNNRSLYVLSGASAAAGTAGITLATTATSLSIAGLSISSTGFGLPFGAVLLLLALVLVAFNFLSNSIKEDSRNNPTNQVNTTFQEIQPELRNVELIKFDQTAELYSKLLLGSSQTSSPSSTPRPPSPAPSTYLGSVDSKGSKSNSDLNSLISTDSLDESYFGEADKHNNSDDSQHQNETKSLVS